MPGVDPELAFGGVILVSLAGLGFAIHAVRSIMERLLVAERAADKARLELTLRREELAYAQTISDYRDTLASYREVTGVKPKPAPVRQKKAPAPKKRTPTMPTIPTIDWNPADVS